MRKLLTAIYLILIFTRVGVNASSKPVINKWTRVYEEKAMYYYDHGKPDSADYCFRIIAHLSENQDNGSFYAWLNIAFIEWENDHLSMARAALILAKQNLNNSICSIFDRKYLLICESIVENSPDSVTIKDQQYFFTDIRDVSKMGKFLQWQIRYYFINQQEFWKKNEKAWVNAQIKELNGDAPPSSFRKCKLLSAESKMLLNTYEYSNSIHKFNELSSLLNKLGLKNHKLFLDAYILFLYNLPQDLIQQNLPSIDSIEQNPKFLKDSALKAAVFYDKSQYFFINQNFEQSLSFGQQAYCYSQGKNADIISFFAIFCQYLNKDSLALTYYKKLIPFEKYRLQAYVGCAISAYKNKQNSTYVYYSMLIHKEVKKKCNLNYKYYWLLNFYTEIHHSVRIAQITNQYISELKKIGGKSIHLYDIYYEIGNSGFERSDYQKALEYFHLALLALLPGVSTTDCYADIDLHSCISRSDLIWTLNNKGEAFYQLSKTRKSGSEEIRDLKACYKNLALSIREIFNYKMHQTTEEQMFTFADLTARKFPNIIKVSLELFNKTHDPQYKEDAFNYAELSKATVLLSMLRSNDGSRVGLIPHQYKQREDSINFELNLLTHELNAQISDSVKALINIKMDHLISKQQTLENIYQKKYPGYYALKYAPEVSHSSLIQNNLKNDECILEYLLTKGFLLLYYLDNKKYIIKTDTLRNVDLPALADKFYKSVYQFNVANYKPDSIRQFSKDAYRLYCILVKPFENEIKGKKLIVIPDNHLNQIPFEAFVTSEIEHPDSYKSLPYLLKNHTVYYAPSATFWAELRKRRILERQARLLALAPIYPKLRLNDTISGTLLAMRSDTSLLSSLPNAKKEIEFAHQIAGGKLLLGKNATESKFKAIASEYDILHFATHGVLNAASPLQSKLLFASSEDKTDDGFLYTYEIYNLKQASQLVILSACNTGAGISYGGEGMVSLARGFLSSGTRSVIMTLWSINDQSSFELIKGFYKNLARHRPIGEALNQSKVDYLNRADNLHSHPFFWTGYVVYGDASIQLLIENHTRLYMILVFVGAGLILMIWKFKAIYEAIRRLFVHKKILN